MKIAFICYGNMANALVSSILLSKNIDLDYLDTLYRSKLKFGTEDEILIRLR